MDLGLKNQTVLVTGGSGGIGQAICRQLHAEHANVVIHYHSNQTRAAQLAEEFGDKSSMLVAADLTDEVAVARAFERASQKFGGIDVLVANAGVWPADDVPVCEMSLPQWQSTLDTNLTSVFLCCRQFLRQAAHHCLQAPAIVMIGSTAGVFGEAGHADYAATKSALIHGLTLSLKNEMAHIAPRGRVNTVSPGWVMTPMARKFTADEKSIKRALATIALRKVAAPEDIAHAVLFLASSKVAGHITGQALTVSGGMEGRQLYGEQELDVGQALPPT